MTKHSEDELRDLNIYHLHSCHSRQAWVKGMTKPFPCDCGLYEAMSAHLQAYASEIEKRMPKEHENTEVPSENLNSQDDGEVMGWNACLEAMQEALTTINQEWSLK